MIDPEGSPEASSEGSDEEEPCAAIPTTRTEEMPVDEDDQSVLPEAFCAGNHVLGRLLARQARTFSAEGNEAMARVAAMRSSAELSVWHPGDPSRKVGRMARREALRRKKLGPVVEPSRCNNHKLYVCSSVVWCDVCGAVTGGDRIVKLRRPCERSVRSSAVWYRLRDLRKGIYRARVLGKEVKVPLHGAARRLAWGDVVRGKWTSAGLVADVGAYRCRKRRNGDGNVGGARKLLRRPSIAVYEARDEPGGSGRAMATSEAKLHDTDAERLAVGPHDLPQTDHLWRRNLKRGWEEASADGGPQGPPSCEGTLHDAVVLGARESGRDLGTLLAGGRGVAM